MIAVGKRSLKVKFMLPALTEATDPYWRPIKYSLGVWTPGIAQSAPKRLAGGRVGKPLAWLPRRGAALGEAS
jgi:hypothetical protein